MENNLLGKIKEDLGWLEKSGERVVLIKNLKNYLDNVAQEQGVDEGRALRAFEREQDIWKEDNERERRSGDSVMEAGLSALRFAMVVNGGAAVALLAFAGDLMGQEHLIGKIGWALMIFVMGAGLVAIASGTRYLCQFFCHKSFLDKREKGTSCWERWGHISNVTSIVLTATSYGTFFYGGWLAYKALVG